VSSQSVKKYAFIIFLNYFSRTSPALSLAFYCCSIPQDFYCINLESAARQWFQAKSKKSPRQSRKNICIRKKKNIRFQNLLALLIQHKKWMANAGSAYEKRFCTKTTTFRTVAIIV
jgi:hypothetical protein